MDHGGRKREPVPGAPPAADGGRRLVGGLGEEGLPRAVVARGAAAGEAGADGERERGEDEEEVEGGEERALRARGEEEEGEAAMDGGRAGRRRHGAGGGGEPPREGGGGGLHRVGWPGGGASHLGCAVPTRLQRRRGDFQFRGSSS